jgi:hypothetical protein
MQGGCGCLAVYEQPRGVVYVPRGCIEADMVH